MKCHQNITTNSLTRTLQNPIKAAVMNDVYDSINEERQTFARARHSVLGPNAEPVVFTI